MNDEFAVRNLASALTTVLSEEQFITLVEMVADAENSSDADALERRLLQAFEEQLEQDAEEQGILCGLDRIMAEHREVRRRNR